MPESTPVPLCDVNAQYRALRPELDAAVLRVLASGQAMDLRQFKKRVRS